MESQTPYLEKRASSRIPVEFYFHCCNINCFGTITNISVNGLFIISKKISFPLESQFEICIPLKNKELNVHVKINRITKSNGYYDGIGVEILNPPKKYLEFVKNRLLSR